MQEKIDKILNALPGILSRFDASLMVETPLYRSKKIHRPLYINISLFYELFDIDDDLPLSEIADLLSKGFSTTIEPDAGTEEVVGTAYVDKQADPLDLSLSGNLGSGRAYYVGSCFNVKGEKTPLAKSAKKKYSDGYLEMERAVWETVVSNALQESMTTGVNPVLAIFDMDEYCDVGWRDEPVRRAKMIRVDRSGELDRVTHTFYLKKPMGTDDLYETAECYGRLEGDKFIERIIHGTWSAGNISPKGHLIDLDTVGAVKGRGPAYSSTRWHHENRFGFEYLGQLQVLKSMVDNQGINKDGLEFEPLEMRLMNVRNDQILRGFVKLMGLEDCIDYIFKNRYEDLDELCQIFVELSRKSNFKDGGYLTKNFEASTRHLFDFARFMRAYPILKSERVIDEGELINTLTNPQQEFAEINHDMSTVEREYINKVYDVIGDCFVTNDFEYKMYLLALKSFVKNYDALVDVCLKNTELNLNTLLHNAFVFNEDRHYLMPYFTATYHISMGARDEGFHVTQKKIETLIQANSRHRSNARSDIRLYDLGYLYIEGQKLCFEFWQADDIPDQKAYIEIEDLRLDGEFINGGFASDPMPNLMVLDIVFEKISLQVPRISIYTQYENNLSYHPRDLIHEG
jgi:hypothetical protein